MTLRDNLEGRRQRRNVMCQIKGYDEDAVKRYWREKDRKRKLRSMTREERWERRRMLHEIAERNRKRRNAERIARELEEARAAETLMRRIRR